MAADYVIVSGDTEPLFADTLEYSNGEPVDLTGATVKLVMRRSTAPEPVRLTGTVTITEAHAGKLYYAPTAADTAAPGNFMANWHVVFAGGETQTFPTEGYLWVQVQPNLTQAPPMLIGVPELKQALYLPANDRTEDERFLEYIESVTPLIEDLTGPLVPQKHDEWYEGGNATISLRYRPHTGYGTTPLLRMLAVSEFRGPIEYDLLNVGVPSAGSTYSFMLNEQQGYIARRTSGGGSEPFWRDPEHPAQSVHVIYEAGQEQLPGNVKRAMIETIRWWHDTTQETGRGSLTQADEEQVRPMVALPYHAEAMLAPTRRHPSFA